MSTFARSTRSWTFVGLAIALLGLPAIAVVYRNVATDPTASAGVLVRELAMWLLLALLIWIILKRECLPLSSIGLRRDHLGRSLAWGLVVTLAVGIGLVLCLLAYQLLGIHYGSEGGKIAASLPITFLTVVRAGVAEEVFYRGYAIERIEALIGSRWAAALISLACFGAFHYRQGWQGAVLVLVIGSIVTAFYVWKRNLIAVIVAHFLVDFVPNVLLPLLSGE